MMIIENSVAVAQFHRGVATALEKSKVETLRDCWGITTPIQNYQEGEKGTARKKLIKCSQRTRIRGLT